ncbi:unnamed protein product [Ambrosiozyma monospora]|uniref:Unnamed protein product n=1 Tax=Ambrosiozyma monospora TaxID=43982 RepID=A0ACB5U9N5_AMBMO|nr:unnamed protein product [Ambrosiozyma monospora]
MLTALELMVLLTRPLMLDVEKADIHRIELYAKLKKAQVVYKNAVLNTSKGKCFKSIVSLALPILAMPRDRRSRRDLIILNLCLTFFKNIIRIEPADFSVAKNKTTTKVQRVNSNLPTGISREDISYDTLFHVYQKNKVLVFIQTIAAGIPKEFDVRLLAARATTK